MPTRNRSTSSRLSRIVGVGLFSVLLLLAGALQVSHAQQTSRDTTEIGFQEAVRIALDQNTDLKRAQATARESAIGVKSEWMDFLPDLSLSTSLTRQYGRNFSQVVGGFTTESTDFLNLGGSSSITLFNGFENVASLRRAEDQSQADEMSLKQTRQDVVFTVMDQFISLVESREIVRVRREVLEARRQTLEQIQAYVDAGSRPVSDLYTQQADVADAEQQLLQGQREVEINKTRLIQTLQLNPREAYDFEVPELEGENLQAAGFDLSRLIDEAFEQRLDLQVAQSERRAAERGVRAARSSYYPSVSLSGDYGTDWSSRGLRNLDDDGLRSQLNANRGGGLRLSVRIPVFDRFNRSTQVERAQVQAQNAEYALQDQRQQVALQVRQAYLDYRNAVQQLEAANTRLKAARQSREATRERYRLGSASIVELQNANRDFVDAASQQVRAQYSLIFERKRVEYRVGRLDPSQPLIRATDVN